MQQPRSVALLGAIYCFALAAAGSLPRGVGPEFASYYEGKEDFSCITNAAIKLSLSQLNDNSCDCPDGSDEPGTAACAKLDPLSPEQPLPGTPSGTTNTTNALPGFWCENKGHVGAYVPFIYVNDGVCDHDLCCDGSEEFKGVGGVKCPNRCAEIGKEHRRLQEEKRKNIERAGKKRRAMEQEAAELRSNALARVAGLKAEISKLEAKTTELKKKHAQIEQQERGKVVRGEGAGGKLGVLVGVAKKRVEELRNTLADIAIQRDALREELEELNQVLSKLKEDYNPNFNDAAVKAAVKTFEDYSARKNSEETPDVSQEDLDSILKEDSETEGVNWKEFEEIEGEDTDVLYNFEAYLPSFLRTAIHERLASIRVWLIENGMLADSGKGSAESVLVKAAREAFEASERDLKSKTTSLENEQKDLEKDYGPSDIFRALKGKCVSTDAGEYTYELCWMEKTSQKSKKGHGNTNMGNFEGLEWREADEEERLDGRSLGRGRRLVMRYDDGQSCWNGPRRRTEVWLGCAETEELWRVAEAEKCVYKMEVGTPAACDVEAAVEEPKGKDEL